MKITTEYIKTKNTNTYPRPLIQNVSPDENPHDTSYYNPCKPVVRMDCPSIDYQPFDIDAEW